MAEVKGKRKMFVSFDEVFHPTREQVERRCAIINATIRQNLAIYGDSCATCKHAVYKQVSPYEEYITCALDRKVNWSRGEIPHLCGQYEFCGFMEGGQTDATDRPQQD